MGRSPDSRHRNWNSGSCSISWLSPRRALHPGRAAREYRPIGSVHLDRSIGGGKAHAKLFVRSTRQVRLTAAGRVFLTRRGPLSMRFDCLDVAAVRGLTGMVFDETGERLTPTYVVRKERAIGTIFRPPSSPGTFRSLFVNWYSACSRSASKVGSAAWPVARGIAPRGAHTPRQFQRKNNRWQEDQG